MCYPAYLRKTLSIKTGSCRPSGCPAPPTACAPAPAPAPASTPPRSVAADRASLRSCLEGEGIYTLTGADSAYQDARLVSGARKDGSCGAAGGVQAATRTRACARAPLPPVALQVAEARCAPPLHSLLPPTASQAQLFSKFFEFWPTAVAYPASTEQVAAAVRCARRFRGGLHPRSGGHGNEGESVATGAITLDMTRMSRVRLLGRDGGTAGVQGGAHVGT